MSYSDGASLRIALDLVASSTGASSLYTMGYALSSLLNTTTTVEAASARLTSALAAQESAGRRVTTAALSQESATARLGVALGNQEIAAQNMARAENDLNNAMTWGTQADKDAALQKYNLAAQTKLAADASVTEAESAQGAAAARLEQAQADQTLAAEQAAAAQTALDLAAAQDAATLSLNTYVAMLLAAAAEAAAFDLSLKGVTDSAAMLQYSSAQMDLALHGTADQIAALNPAIIQWADNSLYTTTQVHQLVQALSEKGLDVSQILNGNGQAAIMLGEAINAGPVDAANLLGSALQVFSSQGLTATQAANTLTAAYYNGIPSATELQTALEDVGGQAATMGISIQDLTSTLDLLAQAGMPASSSALSLRYMLAAISDPTTKAAADMNYLGLTVVNTTSPAFEQLKRKLDAAGAAGQAAVTGFDGTSVGLNAMYKEAQALHLIPLNETFNSWAIQSGAMSSQFFDSKGNFIGLGNAVQLMIDQVKAKSGGNKELMSNLLGDMFNVRSGRAAGLLTNMTAFKDHYNRIIDEMGHTSVKKDSQDLLGTLTGAWKQLTTTFTSFKATIGDALLKPFTGLVQGINGILSAIMNTNPQVLQFVGIFLLVGGVLATVTAIVLGVVVAVMAVAAVVGGPVVAAFAIVLAIIPVVAGIVAFLVIHWNDLTKAVGPWIGAIGQAVSQTFQHFTTVLQPLLGRFAGLGQAFSRLGTAMKPFLPYILQIAVALGGILALVIGLVIGLIMGLVQGFIAALTGIALFVTGVIQLFLGLWTFFTDLFELIVAAFEWVFGGETKQASDKMTTIMGRLGDDLHTIWDGIVNMILGLVTFLVGSIVAFIVGLVDGIIQWFVVLWDTLVGHSIVPDMVNAIIAWFEQLPVRAVNAVTSLVNQVKGLFSSLAQDALSWGANLVKMLALGITTSVGFVTNAASNVASAIHNILAHHSPPAEGPLADDDTYMPNMMRMFATGINQHTPLLANAATNAANTTRFALTQGMAPNGLLLGGSGMSGGGGNQTVVVQVGNQQLFQLMMNQLTGQMQLNGMGRAFK